MKIMTDIPLESALLIDKYRYIGGTPLPMIALISINSQVFVFAGAILNPVPSTVATTPEV